MATRRKEYRFRNGKIIEIEENHDGNYGAPGQKRIKKKKPTEEQMRLVNINTVSYTHLTLPTNSRVCVSGGGG